MCIRDSVFTAPFPAIVAVAALVGWLFGRRIAERAPEIPAGAHALRTPWLLTGALAVSWLMPLGLLLLLRGPDDLLTQLSALYSELALVTFGGAYAVLSHVADSAVAEYGWLTAGQMADGLGLAETTPGPLILVLQFVAFVAAYRSGLSDAPLFFATCASVVAIWCLFVPSFVWIFLGAPHIDRINANRALRTALAFVTATVVGVIAHLSIWFAVHVLFAEVSWARAGFAQVLAPDFSTLDLRALGLTVIAALLLFGLHQSLGRVLAMTALAGLLSYGA